MKKKTIKKLQLDKTVISNFNSSKVKGGTSGSRRGCIGCGNGPTAGTDNCTHTTATMGGCYTQGCPIT